MKRPDFPVSSGDASKTRIERASVTPNVRRLSDARVAKEASSSKRAKPNRPTKQSKSTAARAKQSRETSVARRQREESADARRALKEARKARKEFERNEVRRFTARVRRRRQMVAGVLLSFVALGVFVVVAIFSPVMRVQSIQVMGTTRVDPAAIATQLSDQVGQPLPLVNVGRVEEVLRRQTLVESYSIESRPPNTLILHVVERQPIAYMPAGTGFELKDAAGVTIETSPDYPGVYPLLHVPNDAPTGAAFTTAVTVLRTLPSELRDRISEITATTADDVAFVFADTGQRVFWGSADDSAVKVRALEGLLANWPPGTASEYDVSSKDNVVVR